MKKTQFNLLYNPAQKMYHSSVVDMPTVMFGKSATRQENPDKEIAYE